MAIYSGTMRTPFTGGSGVPLGELQASAIARVVLLEMTLYLSVPGATNMGLGLGRPTVKGGLVTGGWAPLQGHDTAAPTSQTIMAWDWAPAPDLPSDFFRRWVNDSTASSTLRLTFPRGLVIPPGESLALYRLTGSQIAAFDVQWVVDS